MRATALALAAAALVAGEGATLAVTTAAGRTVWWRADRAPEQWTQPHDALVRAVRWRRGAPGVEWGEVSIEGSGEALRTRVIVARLDPRRLRFDVEWGVDSAARALGGNGPRAQCAFRRQRGTVHRRPPVGMGGHGGA